MEKEKNLYEEVFEDSSNNKTFSYIQPSSYQTRNKYVTSSTFAKICQHFSTDQVSSRAGTYKEEFSFT